MTIRHTPFGGTSLGERSVRRRDLYLTTLSTHKRHIHAPGGIRTRNSNKQAAAEPRLTPHGYMYRPTAYKSTILKQADPGGRDV